MKIAIIGAGNLGKSIANGLLVQNELETLYLVKRKITDLKEYKNLEKVRVTADSAEAVKNCEILIFSVQPHQMEEVLKETESVLSPEHLIISTVTGFSIFKIEEIIGEKAVVRAMPNTAIAIGKSMSCLCSNKKGEEKIEKAQVIFNALGTSIIIPEEKMQAATVICASGIAFWMRLIRATTQGAVQLGFDAKEAQELSMQTCLGAASLLIESKSHPEQEIDKVTTPKGCTIEGLNEMEHNGLSSSLIKGIQASFRKINDISQG